MSTSTSHEGSAAGAHNGAHNGAPITAPTVSPPAAEQPGKPPPKPPPTSEPAQQDRHRRRLRIALIATGCLMLVGGAALAAVLLLAPGTPKAAAPPTPAAIYQSKLTQSLTPLIFANNTLSSSLVAVSGRDPKAAKVAAKQAQSTLTSTRGAVGILTVPAASALLAQQTEQALLQENGYLQAVSATLNAPSAANIAQMQPLAATTAAAFVPLDRAVAGAHASISGTDTLVSWANGRVAAAERSRTAAERSRAAAQRRELTQAASTGAREGSVGRTIIVNPPAAVVTPTPSSAYASYPLVAGLTGGALVRSGASQGASVVAQISPSSVVSIVCVANGGAVNFHGSTYTLWDYINSPAGYISDGLVQTGTSAPVAPSC